MFDGFNKIGRFISCDRGRPVSSRISVEFFVFPFTLKSVQFMSRSFLLIVGAFSDVMEELELNFSFAKAEFWIVFFFFFQYYQHGFYPEYFHCSMIY